MCDFRSLFGDLVYEYQILPGCPISEMYSAILLTEKIYSLAFMVLFLAFVLIKRKMNGSNYFDQLQNNSVFILLDDYYTRFYEKKETLVLECSEDENVVEKGFNFFNFKVACCEPVFQCFEKAFYPIKRFFWKHSKSLVFNLVVFGYIFFSPVQYLAGFLTAPCLDDDPNIFNNAPLFIYGILDLIISTVSIFVLSFMISFIASRRELQSFHENDIKTKAYFLHYHVKKGIMIASFSICLKVMLMIISGHTFFDMSLDAVSNIYWLGRGVFFLLLIRRSHSRKRIQIKCNCEFLKEESKFFQIQNFLYKRRIDINRIMDFRVKKQNFMKELEDNLKIEVSDKNLLFQRMMKILEIQKFKNVIVKKNVDSGYCAFLSILFRFYFGVYIFLTILSTLTIIDKRNKNLKDSCFLNSSIVGFTLTDLVEIICFPYLFYKTTRKLKII